MIVDDLFAFIDFRSAAHVCIYFQITGSIRKMLRNPLRLSTLTPLPFDTLLPTTTSRTEPDGAPYQVRPVDP